VGTIAVVVKNFSIIINRLIQNPSEEEETRVTKGILN
jgi:hypothetical protein